MTKTRTNQPAGDRRLNPEWRAAVGAERRDPERRDAARPAAGRLSDALLDDDAYAEWYRQGRSPSAPSAPASDPAPWLIVLVVLAVVVAGLGWTSAIDAHARLDAAEVHAAETAEVPR